MNARELPTLSGLTVRAVHAPLRIPLQTSGGAITIAPMALIDLHTSAGVTGHTYLFCYTPLVLQPVCQLLHNLSSVLEGQPLAPLELHRLLQARFRLMGASGVVGMALAGSTWRRGTRWRGFRGSRWRRHWVRRGSR